MSTYIAIAILLSLLSLGNSKGYKLIIAFLLLTVIGGIRDVTVGTDTQNYAALFEIYGADTSEMYHATEPLFLFIQHFVAINGWPYQVMVFLIMAITMTGVTIFANCISRKPVLVLLCYYLLYFYFYSFNLMRQYLAVSLILISLYFLYIDRIKLYALCVLIAFLFHSTAIIAIIAFFINRINVGVKVQVIVLFLTLLIGITPIVQEISSKLFNFLPQDMFDYITEPNGITARLPISRILLTMYGAFIVFTLDENNLFIKLLTVGICILNLFSFQPVIGRIAQYFTIAQIAIIPNIDLLIKHRFYKIKQIITLASMTYLFVVWIYLISNKVAEIVPYRIFSSW